MHCNPYIHTLWERMHRMTALRHQHSTNPVSYKLDRYRLAAYSQFAGTGRHGRRCILPTGCQAECLGSRPRCVQCWRWFSHPPSSLARRSPPSFRTHDGSRGIAELPCCSQDCSDSDRAAMTKRTTDPFIHTLSTYSLSQGDHSFRKIIFHDFSMTFQDQPKWISMTYRHYIFPEINETWHMNAYQN